MTITNELAIMSVREFLSLTTEQGTARGDKWLVRSQVTGKVSLSRYDVDDPNGGRTTYLGRPTIVVPFVLEYVSLDDIDLVTHRLKELSI